MKTIVDILKNKCALKQYINNTERKALWNIYQSDQNIQRSGKGAYIYWKHFWLIHKIRKSKS